MKLKYFAVLILFIFNFSVTAVADSSHIDFPNSDSQTIDHQSHIQSKDHSNHEDTEQHCTDHDCCHQGHVHVYLLTLKSINVGTESYSAISFAVYIQVFNTAFLEIIKPPLV